MSSILVDGFRDDLRELPRILRMRIVLDVLYFLDVQKSGVYLSEVRAGLFDKLTGRVLGQKIDDAVDGPHKPMFYRNKLVFDLLQALVKWGLVKSETLQSRGDNSREIRREVYLLSDEGVDFLSDQMKISEQTRKEVKDRSRGDQDPPWNEEDSDEIGE